MRTHRDIIKAAGAATLAEQLKVSVHTVRSWAHERRKGIPGEYWSAIVDRGHATLEELAQAAASKRDVTDAEAA